MLKLVIDLFGGRGSSSGGAGGGASSSSGGRYKSVEEFEKSLTGYDDPRLKEYEQGLSDVAENFGASGLKGFLKDQAEGEGLDEWTKIGLKNDKEQAQNMLNELPAYKTPYEFGLAEALPQVISAVDNLLSIKPSGEKKSPYDDIDITI